MLKLNQRQFYLQGQVLLLLGLFALDFTLGSGDWFDLLFQYQEIKVFKDKEGNGIKSVVLNHMYIVCL